MKVEWINPFLGAAEEIFGTYGLEFRRGNVSIHNGPMLGNEVNVAIGITGDLKGQFILSVSKKDVVSLTSTVMSWSIQDFDEMARSCIAETVNMLAGRAAIRLEQYGLSTDVTVPSIITGSDVTVFPNGLQSLIIPFGLYSTIQQTGAGVFSLTVKAT